VIEVVVEDRGWRGAEPRSAVLARRAAAAALASERQKGASLAVLLTSDSRIAELNARFRGKAGPTNVLSFPAPAPARDSLGDIALALGVCEREASAQGKPLAQHLQHLAAHGVLHLLGYDHESEAEALIMEAKERAILAGLGVPDPYAERGAQGDHG
jgi:probable rRNA maturation factor